MSEFSVVLSHQAKKDLKKIQSTRYFNLIVLALKELAVNPLKGDIKSLKVLPSVKYRKRVGVYRILFDIILEKKIVQIYRIVPRGSAY